MLDQPDSSEDPDVDVAFMTLSEQQKSEIYKRHTLTKQKDCPPYFRTCHIHTIPITCIFMFHAHIIAYTFTVMLPSGCH